MKLYIEMVKKLLDKLPFFNYLLRLAAYLQYPSIDSSDRTKLQFEHSLLDIVNALGLAAALIGALILASSHNSHLEIINSFNPLYIVGLYLYYGLVFSSTFAFLVSLACTTNLSNQSGRFGDHFYNLFSHGLRFYAYMGLVLAPMFIHVVGRAVLHGETNVQAFSSPYWFLIILITIIWFPIRLFFKPVYNYINPNRYKVFAILLILLFAFFASGINKPFTPDVTEKLIRYNIFCGHFKSGDLYKTLGKDKRNELEPFFCKGKA